MRSSFSSSTFLLSPRIVEDLIEYNVYVMCPLIRSGPGDVLLLPRLVTVAVRFYNHLVEFDYL